MSNLVREDDLMQTTLEEMFEAAQDTKVPELVTEEDLMQIGVDEVFKAKVRSNLCIAILKGPDSYITVQRL